MKDRYGRELEDIRITLTHACNFSCFFCHMEGEGENYINGLSSQDIALVSNVAKEFGVKYAKLTGGEPTLRRDLATIISSLKDIGLEVSMTTNGFMLYHIASKLKEAGLDRVNISLHSLRRERFKEITGVDGLDKVIEGIKEAVKVELTPVKLNFVVTRKNEDEVFDIIRFAEEVGVNALHLIEMHPVGLGKNAFKYHERLSEIENKISEMSVKKSVRNKHLRPRYYLSSGLEIEVVKPFANPLFCSGCNRIRLTVDGKLKTCLYREDKVIDISDIFKANLSLQDKTELIREAFRIGMSIREPNFKYRYETGKAQEALGGT
ncbi:molybdenum cofactor biosynthesis protein MoaA [Candidatus Acidianus copahuensis]|uniref:Probable GTP 3',8-cyclase n=1 Tax=Candidatus Acidianus copahuensis TaxID=1160895 RepID=A0A031LPA1_9CREN|nr:GTP 3',8-cyclase MoaA [Candidatus Acidianus copahuensis]EZQ06892.1 molybdenum cofactor biosynthesis protein MoaA [Candidatus Acidianus copahuensis]